MLGGEFHVVELYMSLPHVTVFQVITEKAAQTTIHLLMQGANAQDSGVYECLPDNAPLAKIKVHILTAGTTYYRGSFR